MNMQCVSLEIRTGTHVGLSKLKFKLLDKLRDILSYISTFMNFRPFVLELFHVHGRTQRTR
jgi:hypothetical protein